MGGKTAITLGLVAGLVAGGLIVGGVVALAPVPGATAPASSAGSTEASAAPSPSLPPDGSAVPSSAGLPGSSAPGDPTASTIADAFVVGKPPPALTLSLIGGETIDLASLKGKPVWVNFMATWCPPCQDELPLMGAFATRYEDTGLVVLAVDVKEDEATVQTFFQDRNLFLPVALDTDGFAQAAWGAVALPVHFWIDAEGIVRDEAVGGIGPEVMAQGLGSILPGVTVTP